MKHLMKTVFGLSIAALLTVFISCPQPTGPGGAANSGSPSSPQTPPPPPKTPVEKALDELMVSPVQVYNGTDKVDLPITTSVAGVTITWTALPEGYINLESGTEWGKIKKRPAGSESPVDITLTATATKDGKTKTKDFTITIHPATAEPDAQALAAGLAIQPAVSADFILPKTVSGYPAAAIEWTSADDKIIKIEEAAGEKKGVIAYDIIDRRVKLTAQVTYDDSNPATPDNAEKTFNVTVKHIEEINKQLGDTVLTYMFTGNEYTRTYKKNDKITRGTKYTYTNVQTAADGTKTALFTETATYNTDKEKWMTPQEAIQETKIFYNRILTELGNLKKKNPLSLKDFIPLLRIMEYMGIGEIPDNIPDEQIFSNLKGFLDLSDTWEAFNALPPEQKTAKLKTGISLREEQINLALSVMPQEIALPKRYIYRFEKSGAPGDEKTVFRTNVVYDTSKHWYQQSGGYYFHNSDYSIAAGEILSMNLNVREKDSNRYDTRIDILISDGTNHPKNYNGNAGYTPEQTEITATLQEGGAPGSNITVKISNISVLSAGTMTANVQIDGGSEKPLSLQFSGNPLH